MADELKCTFQDAERNHLREGIRMSTRAKIAYFEEMVSLAIAVGARDRLDSSGAADASVPIAPNES
jgi:hypothetical protein